MRGNAGDFLDRTGQRYKRDNVLDAYQNLDEMVTMMFSGSIGGAFDEPPGGALDRALQSVQQGAAPPDVRSAAGIGRAIISTGVVRSANDMMASVAKKIIPFVGDDIAEQLA